MADSSEEVDMSVYTIDPETSVVGLKAEDAFKLLSEQEKSYAYYIGKASWEGAKICLLQCSPESVPIFALLQLVFGEAGKAAKSIPEVVSTAKAASGLDEDETKKAMLYVAAVYGNLGNYKSFGDTKFVPSVEASKFKAFLSACLDAVTTDKEAKTKFEKYWEASCVRMYSLLPRQRQLGLGQGNGVTTYFTANCEEADADICTKFLEAKGVSPYNTRLFKDGDKYTVRVASSVKKDPSAPEEFEARKFCFEFGDYSPLMARICDNLQKATEFCANDHQKQMLQSYIESFRDGSIDAHKEGSRHWIRDVGPAVESYIGFIESYRDPSGSRGEWEGFCACVNKEVSKKFQTLVDGAPELLKLMPWSAEFEKPEFQRPDFTSLEVLAFGSSGVPAGINIPNYDDIRETQGFKNVSLGNVLAASYGASEKPVPFIKEGDQSMFKELKGPAFEVQVGCHELLGHGSGRLYHKGTPDAAAFLEKKVVDPTSVDQKVLEGPFYSEGSTWDTLFGKIASPYEECRAECCGIYLSLEASVLSVFGHDCPDGNANAEGGIHDVTYINWLLMVRAGLVGLEFYTPETKAWRQAHMNARYVILRVLLEAGEGLVTLETTTHPTDGKPYIIIKLDRSKVATVGKTAIQAFLQKLQIYKSLGDLEAGSKMFGDYSQVPDEMAALRKIVMARKEPRKLLVQPHMADAGKEYKEFAETSEGMVESFVARYPALDEDLWALWEAEQAVMVNQ